MSWKEHTCFPNAEVMKFVNECITMSFGKNERELMLHKHNKACNDMAALNMSQRSRTLLGLGSNEPPIWVEPCINGIRGEVLKAWTRPDTGYP